MVQGFDPKTYTVAWICAIKDEVTASRALLDEKHERPPSQPNDKNVYIVGRMERHNVVIAFPGSGSYGADVIAHVVAHLVRTFQNIRFGLMVGIGGGAPSLPDLTDPLNDIRLGDVVISEPKGNHGGVLQYDKGRWKNTEGFEIRSHLNRPPSILLAAMKLLQSDHDIAFGKMMDYFDSVATKSSRLRTWGFRFPGRDSDRLYKSDHPHNDGKNCLGCGSKNIEERLDRESDEPAIHYGLIASGNAVMRSAAYRDYLRDAWGVCCFEMEAAGLMNEFPCIDIRGIADYSDDHKNDHWQRYAAAMAGAYAKDLLRVIQPEEVYGTEVAAKIAMEFSQELSKVNSNVIEINKIIQDDQVDEILNWLCPFDYWTVQSDLLDKRQPGTGRWLLASTQFQHWYKTKGQTLLYQGIPGAGKTIMAAAVIDYIHTQQLENSGITLAFIFCNFRRQSQQRPVHLISSILKQLARQDHRLMQQLKILKSRYNNMGASQSMTELAGLLSIMGNDSGQTYIILDALDEIQGPDKGLMNFLSELFRAQKSTGANILATSRFIPDVEKRFKLEEQCAISEIRAMDEDVKNFIQGNLSTLPSFVMERQDMAQRIENEISQAASGMFLLAKLHLDSLRDKVSPSIMQKALRELPRGPDAYEKAYNEAMLRIENETMGFRDLAIRVLTWVSCTRRPLTTGELQHALAIQAGEHCFDEEDITDIALIASVCIGLVVVDGKSGIIRLVHYTAQEFFEKHWSDLFPNAHRDIADACATYLSYDCIETLEFEMVQLQYPLYSYAARNWGFHARLQSVNESLALRVFRDEAIVDFSSRQFSLPRYCCTEHRLEGPKGISSLHLAAYFGLVEIAKTLIRGCGDVTAKDNWGRSVLSWAAEYGQEELVNYFPDSVFGLDHTDDLDMIPLELAVLNGH